MSKRLRTRTPTNKKSNHPVRTIAISLSSFQIKMERRVWLLRQQAWTLKSLSTQLMWLVMLQLKRLSTDLRDKLRATQVPISQPSTKEFRHLWLSIWKASVSMSTSLLSLNACHSIKISASTCSGSLTLRTSLINERIFKNSEGRTFIVA